MRTLRDVAPYRGLLRPGGAFGYLGWAGEGNVGDDLMYLAHRRVLGPLPVARVPARRTAARLGLLARAPAGLRVRAMLLGGGTLFGRHDWLERIDAVEAVAGPLPWMALGVGVEEPGLGFTDAFTLRRWCARAREWPVLGVRGPRSQAILAAHGLEVPVTGDPALLLAGAAPPVAFREGLLGVSLAVPEARHGDATRVAATVQAALATLRSRGWRVRLFVFSRHDAGRAAAVAAELGGELAAPGTLEELLGAIGECHVMLGERLHAVVLAAAAGTPAVALEYRPKLRDFMASIGRADRALRVDIAPPEEIVATVEWVAAERAAEVAHVRAAVAELDGRLRAAAARISSSLA